MTIFSTCFQKKKKEKKFTVMKSQNRYFLENICCSIVLLTKGWNKILGQNAVKTRNVVFDIMAKLARDVIFYILG